jgi:nucleoporin NUP159
LKTGGDDGKDPIKAPVFSTPPAKEEKDEEKPKERTSVFGTPTTPSAKQEEKAPSVISAFPPITKAEDKSKARDAADDEKPPASRKLTDEPSYGNISASSASSSFVEVDAEDDAQSDQDAEHSDVDSFLSDDQEDGSYQDEQSAEEEGLSESGELVEEDRGSQSPEPAAVPLPSSRSTSATPQPEPPVIQISPSPEADADEKQSLPSPQTREPSTTPPGTPVKEVKSLPGSSPARASSPPVQPFSLGLGRPSTRPTRSSPLANTVLPPDDEEETKPAPPLPTPESPKLSPKVVPLKEEEREDETDGQPVSKRPKTPPLLSTLGGPASASTPTPLFSMPPAKDAALIAPAPVTFGLGKQPTAAASTGNLFTTTGPSLFGPKPEVPRASTAPAAPTTAPTSIFGSVPLSTSPKPPFAMPPFNLTGGGAPPLFPATATGKPPTPAPSPFGKLSPAPGQSAFGLPSSFAPAQNQGSPFGGPKPIVAGSSIFGIPAPKQPDAPAPAPAPEPAPAPAGPTPEAIVEEGMQKECIRLVLILEREFKEVSQFSS